MVICLRRYAAILLVSLGISAAPGYHFHSSSFTILRDGSTVNQNRYDSKTEVYLNTRGLADGAYYFQVTDPSGAILLSTDTASCRQFIVSGGMAAGSCTHGNIVPLAPFNDTPNAGGEYKVWIIRQTSTTSVDETNPMGLSFKMADAKTDNFKVSSPDRCTTDCPPQQSELSGVAFYDTNANGVRDANEPWLPGLQVDVALNGNAPPAAVCTRTDGTWSSPVLAGDAYVTGLRLPPPNLFDGGYYWLQTSPVHDVKGRSGYSGTVLGSAATGQNFGSICFRPASGGIAAGFWSTKYGQAALSHCGGDAALARLASLNLKETDGSDFAPARLPDVRGWILSGKTSIAHQLSIQLLAASLGTFCTSQPLDPAQLVDASSFGLGIVSIGSLIDAANADLGSEGGGLTFTGASLRDDEEILKNALEAINNNKLPFASKIACPVDYGAGSSCSK